MSILPALLVLLLIPLGGIAQESASLQQEIRQLIEAEGADSARSYLASKMEQSPPSDGIEQTHVLLARSLILYDDGDYSGVIRDMKRALSDLKEKEPSLEFRIRTRLADSYRLSYEIDSMKMELDHLMEREAEGDSASLATCYLGLYQYYYRGEDKDLALFYIQRARDYSAGIGDMEHAATFDSYIGRLYQDMDEDSLAEYYQDRALDYLLSHGHLDMASYVLLERGSFHHHRGRFEEAEADLLECLRLAVQSENFPNIANAHQFIAVTYAETGRYELAVESVARSMGICDDLDIEICRLYAHLTYAEVYHLADDPEKTIYHAEQVIAYPPEGYLSERQKAYQFLSQALAAARRYEEAYAAKLQETALADSLFDLETEEALGRLREQYEREKNLAEINELKSEAEIERLKRNGLLLGLAIILFLSALIVNREVQRRKKAKALHEAQMELERLEKLRLEEEVQRKNRELSSKALHLAKKNQMLQKLQDDLQAIAAEKGKSEDIREVVSTLRLEKAIDTNWEQFTQQFTELNPDFYKNLNQLSDGLGKSDLRLAALLRMNMSSKEIAHMLNISDEGIKKARYRLRKKLGLAREESLEGKIMSV